MAEQEIIYGDPFGRDKIEEFAWPASQSMEYR